jgi:hypothetical protein
MCESEEQSDKPLSDSKWTTYRILQNGYRAILLSSREGGRMGVWEDVRVGGWESHTPTQPHNPNPRHPR